MNYCGYYHYSKRKNIISGFSVYQNKKEFMWWPIGSRKTKNENGVLFAGDYPESTRITSYFGLREQPIIGASVNHEAIDIGGPVAGTKEGIVNIISSLSGVVIRVVDEEFLGKAIFIKHVGGIETIYSHLSNIFVCKGDFVNRGQVIGKMGSSGVSTGTHLDFQIKVNGRNVNPLCYVSNLYPRLP